MGAPKMDLPPRVAAARAAQKMGLAAEGCGSLPRRPRGASPQFEAAPAAEEQRTQEWDVSFRFWPRREKGVEDGGSENGLAAEGCGRQGGPEKGTGRRGLRKPPPAAALGGFSAIWSRPFTEDQRTQVSLGSTEGAVQAICWVETGR